MKKRRTLLKGLISLLIENGEIKTTFVKAKAIRSRAEKLITKAKKGNLADRRILARFLGKRVLVNRLVEEIAPLFKQRKGGYLRVVRIGKRAGDGATMAKVLFTENVGRAEEKKIKKIEQKKETR